MDRREEIRNADGQLICILKENQEGCFCETKIGKRKPTMPLEEFKKRILLFEENAN